jgi:hypothetical protein
MRGGIFDKREERYLRNNNQNATLGKGEGDCKSCRNKVAGSVPVGKGGTGGYFFGGAETLDRQVPFMYLALYIEWQF